MTHIDTTTAGSLPRSQELIAANKASKVGADGFTLEVTDEFEELVHQATADVVAKQRQAGITLLGDGEYGKAMSSPLDYGAWWSYSFQRVAGLSLTEVSLFSWPAAVSAPGAIKLTSFADRRDRQLFPRVYTDPTSGAFEGKTATEFPSTTGALSYTGQEAIAADIRRLKGALAPGEQGFITSVGPGSAARVWNEHYATDDDHLQAWAEVMRHEYKAITDAGLIVQIDDPSLAENWDQISPEPSVADYRAFTAKRVEALNYAIAGLPKELVRLHLCWGSWHGPHVTDIPINDILPEIGRAHV